MATVTITGAAQADAAQLLYERYYANVYRYALSQLRSPQDAEDAAQNTFLRAFAALQKGTVPENEVAWLFKIAHNVCATSKLAWLRRRRIEAPRDLDTLPVEPASPESRRDELAGLEDALASMPPRLREAFLLREWQGLSYAEIAERLDTSHSAVETLIFRARKHLAQQLEQPLKRVREALGLGPLLNLARGVFEGVPTAVKAAGVIAVAVGGTVAARPLVVSDRPTPADAPTAPAPASPAPVTQAGSRPGPQRAARQRTAVLTTPRSTPVSSQPRVPLAPGASPQDPAMPVPSVAPPSTPTPASTTSQVPALDAPPLPPTLTAPSVTTPTLTAPTVTTPTVAIPSVTTPALPVATPPVPITQPPSSPALPPVKTPDLPPVPTVTAPTLPLP